MRRRRPSHRASAVLACFSLLIPSCAKPQAKEEDRPGSAVSLTVQDILRRCASTYQSIKTYQAVGSFRDWRGGKEPPKAIRWDYARPDRCRLQIGMGAVIVLGDECWTYEAAAKRFRAVRAFTKTPIETAAYLLSRGVPFLVPSLLSRGERALEAPAGVGAYGWRLAGVGWAGGRPCYELQRAHRVGDQGGTIRLWIDQDSMLLRAWEQSIPDPMGGEEVYLRCEYHLIVVNQPVPTGAFDLAAPRPLDAAPAESGSGSENAAELGGKG